MPKYTVNSYRQMTFSNDTADVDHDNATIEISAGQAYQFSQGEDANVGLTLDYSPYGLYDSEGHVGDFESIECSLSFEGFSELVDSLVQLRNEIRDGRYEQD